MRGGGARAVLERDLLVLTSAGRFVFLRTAVIVVLVTVTFAILVRANAAVDAGTRPSSQIGRDLFSGFVISYPLLILLIGPALAAGAIAGERAMDTLPLVLAAPVRPFAFVFAKFASRLTALLVPLVGGVPVAAVCFLYGGISPGLFRDWCLVVLALACMVTAASVVASAYSRTVVGAILAAYLVGVVLPGGEWLLVRELWRASDVLPHGIMDHTAGEALSELHTAARGRGGATRNVMSFVTIAGLFTCASLLLAGGRVSRESQDSGETAARGRVRRQLFRNPVLDRACLALPFRGRGLSVWATFLVVGVLTVVPTVRAFDLQHVAVALNVGTWSTAIVLLAHASQALAAERQQGALAVLQTSRLTSGQIVRGKLLALALQAGLLLLPAVGVAAAALVARIPEFGWQGAAVWLATTAAVLFLFVGVGLWISSRAVTTGKAAGSAFGTVFGGMAVQALILAGYGKATSLSSVTTFHALALSLPPALVANGLRAPGGSHESFVLSWTAFWALAYVVGAILLVSEAQSNVEEGGE